MKTLLKVVAVMVALVVPVAAGASTWKIDPDHTNVQFKVRHLMVSNVKGVFDKVQGMVVIDDANIAKSKANIIIDVSSINTGVAKRDEHLRSPDFFDAAKNPEMKFVAKKVAVTGKETLDVIGDLTIRGITRQVVLSVEGFAGETKDPWGNIRRGASATTKINRKDFGLTWNKALETGGVVIGDDVTIAIEVEMIKEKGK